MIDPVDVHEVYLQLEAMNTFACACLIEMFTTACPYTSGHTAVRLGTCLLETTKHQYDSSTSMGALDTTTMLPVGITTCWDKATPTIKRIKDDTNALNFLGGIQLSLSLA